MPAFNATQTLRMTYAELPQNALDLVGFITVAPIRQLESLRQRYVKG